MTCAVLLGLLVAVPPAPAQETVRVRFTPRAGAALATVTTVRSMVTASGLPALPDGSRFETERRMFTTREVRERVDSGWRVRVVVDSVRARMRAADGRWRAIPAPPLEDQAAVAVVSDRFEVTGIESSGAEDAEVLRALTGWAAGLGFAFPEAAIRRGAGFETGGRLRFDAVLEADSSMPVREALFGDVGLRLDSVQVRPGDSLLHFSYTGRFAPRDLQETSESDDRRARWTGAFAGRLIWSTGWAGVVSGAARVRAEVRMTGTTGAGPVGVQVTWEATLAHRVRP